MIRETTMRESLKKALKNRLLHIVAVLLIVTITAAPEVAVFAADLFVMLDVLGAELFLLCFAVGARLYVRMFVYSFRTFMERLDPYFFIPSRRQIAQCPGISAHSVPGYVSLYLFAICWPSVAVDA